MSQAADYIQFCQSEKELPLFHQYWYLDAVCGEGNWSVALVYRNYRIVASMPYLLRRKGPFKLMIMPLLCKMLGPYLCAEFRTARQEHKLYKALIDQLPAVHYFEQNFHYQVQNWLPFYWQGYRQSTAYSYCLDLQVATDQLFQQLDTDYRNNKIPKAQKQLTLSHEGSIEELYAINAMSFERQGLRSPFSLAYLKKLDQALVRQNARQLFFARDTEGRLHSVAYLAWDQQSSYLLIAGDDPALRKSGGGILTVWEAIRYSQQRGLKTFDFIGSMIEPIERVRRKFGAQQVHYSMIKKYSSKIFLLLNEVRNGF